jgi:Flp pilus assembly protein TadG
MVAIVKGWLRRRCTAMTKHGPDCGAFAALELVILFPFILVMIALVAAFGRVERGRQLVDQAAQAASRAGSLASTPYTANSAAQNAASETLRDGGLSCSNMTVTLDTSQFHAGGTVIAHVSCRADLSGLAMSGVPGSVTLTADATSPLDRYRQLGTG